MRIFFLLEFWIWRQDFLEIRRKMAVNEDLFLPEGWRLCISRSKNKHFYHHAATNKTQWKHPGLQNMASYKSKTMRKIVHPTKDCDKENRVNNVSTTYSITTRRQQPFHVHRKLENTTTSSLKSILSNTPSSVQMNPSNTQVVDFSIVHANVLRAIKVATGKPNRMGKIQSILPWNHQLDAITKLIDALKCTTPQPTQPVNYLIQHSAGSGKSLTIACLAHQLVYLTDSHCRRFHTIFVLVDRIQLDEQLGDTVEFFLKKNGIDEVFRATSVENLASLLNRNEKEPVTLHQMVIITTTHKFVQLSADVVLREKMFKSNGNLNGRVAVIADEAHRTHRENTRTCISDVISVCGTQPENMTYIGFSATPSDNALKLFGTVSPDGEMVAPFHCFSMKEAVQKGIIIDVLQNYESCIINRDLSEQQAAEQKVECLVNHFRKIKQTFMPAKCMLVTHSRNAVVMYHQLIQKSFQNKGLKMNVYCTFSGSIILDNNLKQTEQDLNQNLQLGDAEVIIVCDKLETGYNEPRLSAMYVDRILKGARAVQVLSRLNRPMTGKKEAYVLDFMNTKSEMEVAFQEFQGERRLPRKE